MRVTYWSAAGGMRGGSAGHARSDDGWIGSLRRNHTMAMRRSRGLAFGGIGLAGSALRGIRSRQYARRGSEEAFVSFGVARNVDRGDHLRGDDAG